MKSAVNSSDKLSMAVIQAEQYHDLVLDSVLRGWNLQNKKFSIRCFTLTITAGLFADRNMNL